MAAPLIVVSVASVVLLALFLPVKRIYSDIPSLALVLWLLTANLIHAVNAVVWTDNVDVHSTIWCDITSKLLLGVNTAIPGAFVCIGRQLEMVSSKRKWLTNPVVKRNTMIFEVLCCFIIPIIAMSLHVISQNHRFDLVRDYGCSASIHHSSPALVTIWTLPLILCTIALIFGAVAIHHSFHRTSHAFTSHLAERTSMTTSIFFRRLTTTMVVSGIMAVTIIFSLFTIPALKEWTSWEAVHANLDVINIVAVEREINIIRTSWWTLFAISALYIFLSLIIGEETRDSYRWMRAQWSRRNQFFERFKSISFPVRRPQFALHQFAPRPKAKVASPSSHNVSVLELKSGWDDMIDFKQPGSPVSSKRSKTPLAPLLSPQSRSPSSASTHSEFSPISTVSTGPMTAEDTAFMNSTNSYLGSPPAQVLGVSALQSALRPPPAAHTPRNGVPVLSVVTADPVLPISDLPVVHSPGSVRSPAPKRSPSRPKLGAALHAEWPVPPSSPSPPLSRYEAKQPTHSSSPSIDSTLSDVPSYYRHIEGSRPFEGASIPSPRTTALSLHSQRGPSLKQSLQSLRVSWEKMTHGPGGSVPYPGPDGIYMTVVQETV